MAVVTATKFLERMEHEESLRTQLYISRPEDLEQLTIFARGKGFIFSHDDLVEALENYQERFATGSIEPLKTYLTEYRRLVAPTDES
ncbi:MAG: Nif11 family protein [Anaerolineae bacterium]